MTKANAIDLSKPMQRHIAAAVLRVPQVMARVRPFLDPDHFDDDDVSDVVAWSRHHYDEHNEVPSKAALLDVFPDQRRLINRLFKEDIPDVNGTVHRISHFANVRAMKLAIIEAAKIVRCEQAGEEPRDDDGRVITDDPVDMVKAASLVGRDRLEIGDDFFGLLEADLTELTDPAAVPTTHGTGIAHLDRAGVAIERGEIGCVLGAAKHGKSHVLVNVARNALRDGLNVIYYTLEMPSSRLRRRMQSLIAGPKQDYREDPVRFARAVRRLIHKQLKGQLLIKRWPAYFATPTDLRAHLTQVVADGFRPDMVIVDYGGLLKPDRDLGEKRHNIAEVWLEMRAMAGEFDVYWWSAAQANRGAVNKPVVTMADFAECFEIVQHIDVGFSISMTDDERDANQGRFFVLASRNERDGTVVEYQHDYSRSRIITTGFQEAVSQRRRRSGGPDGGAEERSEQAFQEAQDRRRRRREGR